MSIFASGSGFFGEGGGGEGEGVREMRLGGGTELNPFGESGESSSAEAKGDSSTSPRMGTRLRMRGFLIPVGAMLSCPWSAWVRRRAVGALGGSYE